MESFLKGLFSKQPRSEMRLNRWSLFIVGLLVVATALVIWELVEHNFFAWVNPRVMHRIHLVRDVLGASLTTLIAVRVVLHNWERAQGEIIKRDKFLASIVDSSHDAIVVLQPSGVILFWNRAATQIFGHTSGEATGKSFQFLQPLEFGHGEGLSDFLSSVLQRGEANYETELMTRAGKRLFMNLTAAEVRDAAGNVMGISIILQDITQKRLLQDRLVQSDRVAALGQVAASIAHEIGTPLNVISGNAEYLLGEKDLRRSPGKELKIIIEETERISKLIKRLMHITQPQALDMKEVQLNHIVRRVLDFTAHEMEKAGIALDAHVEDPLPPVRGDADQLEQVFLNLVMNAIEAMPHGGKLFVSTSLWHLEKEKNPVVQVRVSDTGSGIPKEIMPKVFDPFFTTKKAGVSSGLGLSISYRILEDHKGTIKIESVPGKGTTVTIRIPSA